MYGSISYRNETKTPKVKAKESLYKFLYRSRKSLLESCKLKIISVQKPMWLYEGRILSFIFVVRNHVKLGVFSKGTVLCGGCWLWAWQISGGLQTCIAERSKVTNSSDGRSGFPFPLRFAGGRLELVTQAFGGSPKLSSRGLSISMTNPIVQN